MPAMITHYLLGKRLLPLSEMPPVKNREAFLLGTQGPDIFFFFRAYPWLPGKKGMPIGLGLHDARPSLVVQTVRDLIAEADVSQRSVIESYALGFLCHYAADRKIHPYVLYWQEDLMNVFPEYATIPNPYHYRIESALDTLILRHDSGEYVSSFELKSLVPKKNKERDAALAWFYHHLILRVLGNDVPEKKLKTLTSDLRHSMGWMTDRNEMKGKAIRFAERMLKKGAFLSALLRTKEIDNYDYPNEQQSPWLKTDNEVSRQSFFELCDETTTFAATMLRDFIDGVSAEELTAEITFAGKRYQEEVTTDETHSEL
ncbi:MAG: zinc dependent phospholipase C family protein [Clostridia bacterium]|nr:zinc dependent phospholipase C family protein [Clostridia bacterium]